MLDKLLRISFIFSIIIFIFFLGYLSHKFKAKIIFQTFEPLISFIEIKFNIDLDSKFGDRDTRNLFLNKKKVNDTNYSLHNKPNKKFTNFLFVKLDNYYPVLMDSPNNIVWKWNLNKFRNAKKIVPYLLFKNGDIIVGKYETKGLYRLNKNGKILWSNELYNHHWISHDENNLYIPGTIFLNNKKDLDEKIFDNSFIKNCDAKHKSRFGTIMIVNKINGELKKEISLIKSFYKTHNSKTLIEKFAKNCADTLHLNDVRVLNSKQAKFFPNGKKGDFLVSFRNIHMITLIDRDTYEIKWHVQGEGKFSAQHSPRVTENGTILIFDNSYDSKNAKSRVVEIDISTKKIVGSFEGRNFKFYSATRGRLQLIDKKIIVQSSDQGEIFEINCKSKFISNESCNYNFLFTSVFSSFYPDTGYSIDGKYNKDRIYIGDFYKNLDFLK